MFRDIDSPDTLYLFTADHGHVYADARETIYLNERIPELADCLPMSPTGNPIYPNGSPRDVFLHVRPERRDEVLALLHRHLDEIALVMPMDDGTGAGPVRAATGQRRSCAAGSAIFSSFPVSAISSGGASRAVMANTFHGHHGGLSPEEVITVLGAIDAL